MMKFNCSYNKLVPLHLLKPHPKNTNEHPRSQIELLAEIIKYQGQRLPIVVSNLSGFITKGHGRLMALQELAWECGAVDYQDYEDEVQEYADMEADNRIAELAERDENKFQENLKLIPLDFDLKLMGFKIYDLPRIEIPTVLGSTDPEKEWDGMPEFDHQDKTAFRSIIVHFANQTHVDDFAKLVGQKIAEKTKMLWFPFIVIETYMDKTYKDIETQ